MQKLALFDLDDTLVDRRAAFNVWAEEFAAAQGLGDRDLTLLVLAGAQHAGPMDGFFAMICEAFDLTEDPGELWRQYRRRMPELVSCRAEDLDALLRLQVAGWRIGIVTNGMADNQLAKIRNTGLDELVDGWAISSEVGCRKPDPEIFRLAAARCGANRRAARHRSEDRRGDRPRRCLACCRWGSAARRAAPAGAVHGLSAIHRSTGWR